MRGSFGRLASACLGEENRLGDDPEIPILGGF